MKVCIIVPKGFPVPCVKGGAIESLITDIINQNEIEGKMDIAVASIYNEQALNESKKYSKTKFIYIKTNTVKYCLKSFIVRIKNIFGYHQNTYNEVILDKIKRENFDYIIVEDGAYHSFRSYLHYFKKNQMILHFHHCGVSDKYTDYTFEKFFGVSDFVTNKFSESSVIKNCITLRNGIDTSKFNISISDKEKSEFRKSIGFSKDDFIIVFCGRLIPEKGVLELIEAVNSIENKNIKLMIVGSINFGTNTKSKYLEKIEEAVNNSSDRIRATGFVNNKELYKYYNISDVGIVPSICEDAAPLVAVEIMASKLPLIITKTGGAPEYVSKDTIIIPNDENIVKNLKDSIMLLYNDVSLRDKIAKAGEKRANKFTTKEFYNNFIKSIYR